MKTTNGQRLCRLEVIEDGGSTDMVAEINGERTGLILVRKGDKVYVYINVCPHIGAPLDFTPGKFLNLERTMIQCAMHGALFRIEDGHCIHGPCSGKHLTEVASEVRERDVWLLV
jgi:nitrite reductase/ring-hydroxylating ferredoxin subunit